MLILILEQLIQIHTNGLVATNKGTIDNVTQAEQLQLQSGAALTSYVAGVVSKI